MPNMSAPVPGTNHSEVFKDGTHKHGGSIYAVNVFEDGRYVARKYLGVVKRRNDRSMAAWSYTLPDGNVISNPAAPEDERYLVNDWTAPSWVKVNGKLVHFDDGVHYFRTRKQAMAFVNSLA